MKKIIIIIKVTNNYSLLVYFKALSRLLTSAIAFRATICRVTAHATAMQLYEKRSICIFACVKDIFFVQTVKKLIRLSM